MKFELELKNEPISNESLIADMQRVAKALGRASLRYHEYKSQGKFSPNTVTRRFGGWNKALELARLTRFVNTEFPMKNCSRIWKRFGFGWVANHDEKRFPKRIPSTAAVHTSIDSKHGTQRYEPSQPTSMLLKTPRVDNWSDKNLEV